MLIVDRQDDSTDREKHVCSGRGFQLTCLLCIYIAVWMSIGTCRINVMLVLQNFKH